MDRPLGTLTRLVAGLVPVALLWLPTVSAADPDDPGPALTGVAVTGTTDPDAAPALASGRYLDHLPASGEVNYRLPRTASGSTFHVAAMFVGAGDSIGEGLRLEVGTTPGDQGCGSGGVFRPTAGEPAPLLFTTVSTWTDVADHPCATATDLYLSIEPPSDSADVGREFEILVYEEPPLSSYSFGLLATPETPTWTPMEPGRPARDVTTGTSPENAPVVGDGTYRVRLEPGRTSVLAVPLDWDQSVQAQLDATLPQGARTGEIAVQVVAPLLGTSQVALDPPPDWTSDAPARGGRLRTGALSHVVSYTHRDSLDASINSEAMAGLHYLMVTWRGAAAADRAAGAPARLTVRVDGVPGDGLPAYAAVDGLAAPTADSRLAVAPSATGGTTSDDRGADSPGSEDEGGEGSAYGRALNSARIGAGIGAVLLCGITALAVRRRTRRHRS